MKKTLFFILLLSLFISCDKKKYHVVEFFPNQKIKCEYDTTNNGKNNGIRKDYFQSGQLRLITQYKQGVLNGISSEYYKNGKQRGQASFTLGKANGWFIALDSLGNIKRKEQSILIYKNMFNVESFKFLENDTVDIAEKEEYTNSCLIFHNNKLKKDSSYYCTINFKNKSNNIIALGDSLNIYLEIPYHYFSNDIGEFKFMLRIEDSNNNKVIVKNDKKMDQVSNIPYYCNASVRPKKKGEGYIFGVIREVNSKKETHDFYFKEKYIVR